jgi:hypothetical protein
LRSKDIHDDHRPQTVVVMANNDSPEKRGVLAR